MQKVNFSVVKKGAVENGVEVFTIAKLCMKKWPSQIRPMAYKSDTQEWSDTHHFKTTFSLSRNMH